MATSSSMSDEEAMLAKVAEDGNALKHASDKWKNNTKVVLAVAAKRGCAPAADDSYEYDGWMPLKGGGEYDTDYGPDYFHALFPLVLAAPVLKGTPTLRRVAGIVNDAKRAAACADPATVWAVEVEQQAIVIRTGILGRHSTEESQQRSRHDDEDSYHRYRRCGCYDEDGCGCGYYGGGIPGNDPDFTGGSIHQVAEAAEKVAASQAAPLQIVDIGGTTYLLAAGWWSVPGGDLVAQALAQHPALAEAGQRFYLATPHTGSNGAAVPATVPLLLSGPTPPKAALVWLADGEDAPAPAPARENKNILDWSSKEVVLAEVVQDGCTLKYASTELRNNKAVVLAAVAENGRALYYASSELQRDKAVVLAAAAAPDFNQALGCFIGMECIPAALQTDTDVMRAAAVTAFADGVLKCQALRDDEWDTAESVLARVPDGFLKDSTFWSGVDARTLLQPVHHHASCGRQERPWELPNDEEVVLAVVTGYGPALKHAPDQLKGNKKVALAAANQDGRALKYVSGELEDDEQLILAAAIPGPRSPTSELLHAAGGDFTLDKGEFLSALSESRTWCAEPPQFQLFQTPHWSSKLPDCSGLALKHAPAELKSDMAFIVAAAARSGEALAGVPALLKANVELRLSLVSKLGYSLAALGHAPPALKASPSLKRVASIVDDAERAAACADPATVWAVEVEQQAIVIQTGAALAGSTEETDADFWLSSDDDDDDDHYMQCSCTHQDGACTCPRDHTAEFTAELVAELEQCMPPAAAKAIDARLKLSKPFDEETTPWSAPSRTAYYAQCASLSNASNTAMEVADAALVAAARADPDSAGAGDSNIDDTSWGAWFETAPLEADSMAAARFDDDDREASLGPREASLGPGGWGTLAALRAICDCWESDHWGSCCAVVERAVDAAAERVAASQAAPLQIVDIGGNTYPLEAGWWSVPGGDLVAQALAQHPALAEAGQRFELVTSDGAAVPATVPLLLSGPTPPKTTLIWLSDDDADASAGAPAKRPRMEADSSGAGAMPARCVLA